MRDGLRREPKELAAKYFYDALGSQLFEAICELPWYRITRAEQRLLERAAGAILRPLGGVGALVELGCGSGRKLAVLADALEPSTDPVAVHLVDISPTALELSKTTLARFSYLSVRAHRVAYAAGLAEALARPPAHGRVLVLFLGSNIGNFHPPEAAAFLEAVRGGLRGGDALLLGADLVKPTAELLLAYDDPLGVTAAFNKNLLVRVNRELAADFDPAAFTHRAVWNAAASRVEMHLVSAGRQVVRIPGADLTVVFGDGELLWTESSYKYTPDGIAALGAAAGFRCVGQWIEPEARFALSLFLAS